MQVTCAAPTGDKCGEGAIWHAKERAVYWTDINRFLVHRYDEASGAVRKGPAMQVVAANDLADADELAYLLSHDSVHRCGLPKAHAEGGALHVGGSSIALFKERTRPRSRGPRTASTSSSRRPASSRPARAWPATARRRTGRRT